MSLSINPLVMFASITSIVWAFLVGGAGYGLAQIVLVILMTGTFEKR